MAKNSQCRGCKLMNRCGISKIESCFAITKSQRENNIFDYQNIYKICFQRTGKNNPGFKSTGHQI